MIPRFHLTGVAHQLHHLGGRKLGRNAHQITPSLPSREQLQHLHPQACLGQVGAREFGAGQNHTSSAGRTWGVRRQYQPSPHGTRTLPWAANRSR